MDKKAVAAAAAFLSFLFDAGEELMHPGTKKNSVPA